ncbi:hypothetical protein CRUP_003617, partial [Coryphaenoides rupestris]
PFLRHAHHHQLCPKTRPPPPVLSQDTPTISSVPRHAHHQHQLCPKTRPPPPPPVLSRDTPTTTSSVPRHAHHQFCPETRPPPPPALSRDTPTTTTSSPSSSSSSSSSSPPPILPGRDGYSCPLHPWSFIVVKGNVSSALEDHAVYQGTKASSEARSSSVFQSVYGEHFSVTVSSQWVQEAEWTEWFDRDDERGSGDWEKLSELHKNFPDRLCSSPLDIQHTPTHRRHHGPAHAKCFIRRISAEDEEEEEEVEVLVVEGRRWRWVEVEVEGGWEWRSGREVEARARCAIIVLLLLLLLWLRLLLLWLLLLLPSRHPENVNTEPGGP